MSNNPIHDLAAVRTLPQTPPLVFLLDVGKGYLAVQIPVWMSSDVSYPVLIGLGALAILGHSFSVWLSFKGGKGVATALGAFLAITLVPTALAFGAWLIIFLTTRTVSIASVAACGVCLKEKHKVELDMNTNLPLLVVGLLLVSLLASQRLVAQNDVADVNSRDLRVDKDENKRYFLVGPHRDAIAPKDGFRLIVLLPGGDGSADFHPFVN